METKAIKEYHFSKFTKGLCLTTLSVYGFVFLLCVWQSIMSALYINGAYGKDSAAYGLLFFRANHSVIILIIEALFALYCLLGAVSVISALVRVSKTYLTISEGEICGLHMPEPHNWDSGAKFTISPSDIVSTGIVDVRLYGRVTAEALVINTEDKKYVVPAIHDVKDARKQVERVR